MNTTSNYAFPDRDERLRVAALSTAYNLASRRLEKAGYRPSSEEVVQDARLFLAFLSDSAIESGTVQVSGTLEVGRS